MAAEIRCDMGGAGEDFPHSREHCVGRGHAARALRADWQEQMRRTHDELIFRQVRFHGLLEDDTETQLSKSRRSALRDQAREAKRKAGGRPLYYTEWCTSSNPRDPMHDEPYAAAFITKTVVEPRGLVEGYSYWSFSDILEENCFPSQPFHGGFGLLNLHGIAKPAYRAYQLLHGLGTALLTIERDHPTVDAWLVREGREVTVILCNFALPRHEIAEETVQLWLDRKAAPLSAESRRFDDAGSANAKALRQEMGAPDYLSTERIVALETASKMCSAAQRIFHQSGWLVCVVRIQPLGIAAIQLEFASGA